MENQPRFDLKDALLRWRRDLAGRPGIAAEDVRELETHLLEGLTAFQRRGLSEERAFAQAKEQLGSAAGIATEFAKAHRLRIWRDRVFWIALLTFATALCYSAIGHPVMELARWLRGPVGAPGSTLAVSVLSGLPTLLLCGIMVSGHAELVYRRSSWFFCKRRRLGFAGLVAAVAANLFTYRFAQVLTVFELACLGFATLVMPGEIRAASALNDQERKEWQTRRGVWRDRLFWLLLAELTIGVWTILISAGANGYILRLPEAQRGPFPLMVSLLFFLSWLGPLGIAGLIVWTGRLPLSSRVLDSRGQVALIAGGLTLMSVGARFWLSTWNVSTPRFPAAEWKFAFLVDTVASLFTGVVFVALIVWMLPWQRQRWMAHRTE